MKYFKFLSTLVVFFSLCFTYSLGDVVNTCGNVGNLEPQLAEECTGVSYKDGTCCFVHNTQNDIKYCVFLLGSLREQSIQNFYNEIDNENIKVDCNSRFISISMVIFFIFAIFI